MELLYVNGFNEHQNDPATTSRSVIINSDDCVLTPDEIEYFIRTGSMWKPVNISRISGTSLIDTL